MVPAKPAMHTLIIGTLIAISLNPNKNSGNKTNIPNKPTEFEAAFTLNLSFEQIPTSKLRSAVANDHGYESSIDEFIAATHF